MNYYKCLMNKMLDFNKGIEQINKFGGSEAKTTLLFEGKVYMLKYPDPVRDKRNLLSYMNNQYSEHIGSCIFKSCGFEAQETAIGTFKGKIVVGCKDFTQDGSTLYEFSKLRNQSSAKSVDGRTGTSIEVVYDTINNNPHIKHKREVIDRFWDMFVIDALIGNKDRHFDNWGLLSYQGELRFAPIYDCGSALSALHSDEKMADLLKDSTAFKNDEYNIPSCYTFRNKRILYHEIFRAPFEDFKKAIIRITPLINMGKIKNIIESAPGLPELRKRYLAAAINMRFEQIIAPAFKRITKREIIKKPTLKEQISRIEAERKNLNSAPKTSTQTRLYRNIKKRNNLSRKT